ncbi:cytochrome c, partial [Roseisolibacter sp. H3M3-2]|uniref:c-type cytochrome n=1 Tax=Roseisolibacter sp. H3M3-2 TaxID=3031323 RepID=UPI0023DC8D72
ARGTSRPTDASSSRSTDRLLGAVGGARARLGLGPPATRAEVAAWDRDVDPSGHGLPPGSGGYDAGARVYAARCAACHGARGEGQGAFPKLVQAPGTAGFAGDSFPFARDHKLPKTVGTYWPYATTLYDYVRHAMPYDRPGSLTPDETYAVVAWLLAENGAVPRTAVMDARSLPRVELAARRHFVPDDRRGGPELR